jgi:hypothetical protein
MRMVLRIRSIVGDRSCHAGGLLYRRQAQGHWAAGTVLDKIPSCPNRQTTGWAWLACRLASATTSVRPGLYTVAATSLNEVLASLLGGFAIEWGGSTICDVSACLDCRTALRRTRAVVRDTHSVRARGPASGASLAGGAISYSWPVPGHDP